MRIRIPYILRNSRSPSSSFVRTLMIYSRGSALRCIRGVYPPALKIYLPKPCGICNIVCGHYVKRLAFGICGIPLTEGKFIPGLWPLLSVPGLHLGWLCSPPLKPSRFFSEFPDNRCVSHLEIFLRFSPCVWAFVCFFGSWVVCCLCSSSSSSSFSSSSSSCLLFLSVLVLPPFLSVLVPLCRNLPPRCCPPPLLCRLFVLVGFVSVFLSVFVCSAVCQSLGPPQTVRLP